MPLQTDFDCDSLPLQRFAWARFGAVQLLLLPAPAPASCSSSSLCCFSLSRSSLDAQLLFSRCDSVRAPLSGSALFMPQYIDIYICIYPSSILYICTIYITCSQSHLFVLYCILFLFFRLYPLIALTAWAFYFALEIVSTFCFPHTHTRALLKDYGRIVKSKEPGPLSCSLSLSLPLPLPLFLSSS